MSSTKHLGRGWVIAVAGIAVALVIAGYGIWTRGVALNDLQQLTDDTAIPRVQVTVPKPGPAERTVTLPGNVMAWNEAPIYAQVSGYVTKWDKDYGAQVEQGEVLAEIDAPGLDGCHRRGLSFWVWRALPLSCLSHVSTSYLDVSMSCLEMIVRQAGGPHRHSQFPVG